MDGFRRVPSALKRLLIEIFAVFLFPIFVTGIVSEVSPETFSSQYYINGATWIYALIGPILVTWLMSEIFRPRVKVEGWFPSIGRFEFCSTHPSYVLSDLIAIAFARLFFSVGIFAELERPAVRLVLGSAIGFPAARLTAWYLLCSKINDFDAAEAYKPALWTFVIFAGIFGSGFTFTLL